MSDFPQPPSETQWNEGKLLSLWRRFSMTMLTSTRQTNVEVLIIGADFKTKGS